ncbi:MAG: hypothetical protein PHG66_05095 [Candidatus Colwellbacteria bacterium]|nr:hypothetical protein [Candidatus Colwellbacteria bacterium]
MIKHSSVVRTVYLYLFSLVGLCLIVIGGVRFLDMGLRAFVFPKADENEAVMRVPTYPPFSESDIKKIASKEGLTEDEKASIELWVLDYKKWQESEVKYDYVAMRRSQEASTSIALILIGLPLYLYHWSVVRREALVKEAA